MASNINPTDIDITYPIAGQDNDTKGFRDNFTIIKNNFNVAGKEITAIQTVLSSTITALTSVPVNSTDRGTRGQMAYDSNYLYICIDTNTWVRIAVTDSTF